MEEDKTLLNYVREKQERLEEDLKACQRKIADLEARREVNDRFLERVLMIGTFVLLLWKSFH